MFKVLVVRGVQGQVSAGDAGYLRRGWRVLVTNIVTVTTGASTGLGRGQHGGGEGVT